MTTPTPPRPPRPGREAAPPAAPATAADADIIPLAPEVPAAAQQFPCRQCGAQLTFAPGARALQCAHCGCVNELDALTGVSLDSDDFVTYLRRLQQVEETEEHSTVSCESCGATVDRPAHATALACPFCGAAIVATALSRRLIKPKALLPFGVARPQAEALYAKWVKSLWFAPNALKRQARLEQRLVGIYVPFWTYDARTVTQYTGRRGEHYYVTVGSGKNRRTERRTRWYPRSGVVTNRFRNLLVLASRSLPRKQADRLEPWGLNELVPYQDGYLSGFQAESYQIDLADGFKIATQLMVEPIRGTIRADIGGDEQQILSMQTQYHDVAFRHILLPVWISAYRFRERSFRVLVNARTGEVQGERPWSWVKITLAVVAGLAVAAAVVAIVSRL
jgi:predicted RNA-binding Zn-ribbon protein involved in translation (DUF1610 family)